MKRVKKIMVATVMSLLLIFSFGKSFKIEHIAAAEYVSSYDELFEAVRKAGVSEVVIEKSFELTNIIQIPNGKTITIRSADAGNPVTLKRSGEVNGGYGYVHILFDIEKGGALTLSNIIIDGNKGKANSYIAMVMVYGTFTLENSVLKNNDTTSAGLMSFTYGGAINVATGGKAVIRNSTVSGNVSLGTGGAIHCQGEIIVENSEFYDNVAKSDGGAIYLPLNTSAMITDSIFKNNKAPARGGAIHVDGGRLDIYDSEISNNVAGTEGGGISDNGVLVMKGCLLKGNKAAKGGALNAKTTVAGVSAALENNRFIKNQASEEGGAIYLHLMSTDTNTVKLINHEFKGNSAKLGGAIYVDFGTVIIQESTISDNEAQSGGGIYVVNWGRLVLNSGSITDNTATRDGGGVFVQDYKYVSLPEGSTITFSGNKANSLYQPPSMPVIPESQWQGTINSVSVDFAGDAHLTVLNNFDINYNLTEVLQRFAISYLANGGGGSTIVNSDLIPGVAYTLVNNPFTAPLDKEFVAWNTQDDGNGTDYKAGQIVVMPKNDLTLHAIWREVLQVGIEDDENKLTDINEATVVILYLPNGGSGEEVRVEDLITGEKIVIASSNFTAPPAKQFVAWNTRQDGKGDSFQAGQEILIPETNLQLYAIWSSNAKLPNTGDTVLTALVILFMIIAAGIFICLIKKQKLNRTNR